MTDNTEALPPLPEPQTIITDADVGSRAYTAWQMRDYARAAIDAAKGRLSPAGVRSLCRVSLLPEPIQQLGSSEQGSATSVSWDG